MNNYANLKSAKRTPRLSRAAFAVLTMRTALVARTTAPVNRAQTPGIWAEGSLGMMTT